MATIKSFTDISQSKKLAEILPIESADMCYMYLGREDKKYQDIPICAPAMEGDLCAWSLSALLDILPYPQLSKDKLGSGKVGWMISVYPNDCRYDSCWHDNPIDACYKLVLKLHELNLL